MPIRRHQDPFLPDQKLWVLSVEFLPTLLSSPLAPVRRSPRIYQQPANDFFFFFFFVFFFGNIRTNQESVIRVISQQQNSKKKMKH